jgi:NAD dependent epimerase/dehydratase family enzyme
MLPFFKLGVGGPVAGGKQYVPWIHLDDMVGALIFSLDDPDVRGPDLPEGRCQVEPWKGSGGCV